MPQRRSAFMSQCIFCWWAFPWPWCIHASTYSCHGAFVAAMKSYCSTFLVMPHSRSKEFTPQCIRYCSALFGQHIRCRCPFTQRDFNVTAHSLRPCIAHIGGKSFAYAHGADADSHACPSMRLLTCTCPRLHEGMPVLSCTRTLSCVPLLPGSLHTRPFACTPIHAITYSGMRPFAHMHACPFARALLSSCMHLIKLHSRARPFTCVFICPRNHSMRPVIQAHTHRPHVYFQMRSGCHLRPYLMRKVIHACTHCGHTHLKVRSLNFPWPTLQGSDSCAPPRRLFTAGPSHAFTFMPTAMIHQHAHHTHSGMRPLQTIKPVPIALINASAHRAYSCVCPSLLFKREPNACLLTSTCAYCAPCAYIPRVQSFTLEPIAGTLLCVLMAAKHVHTLHTRARSITRMKITCRLIVAPFAHSTRVWGHSYARSTVERFLFTCDSKCACKYDIMCV